MDHVGKEHSGEGRDFGRLEHACTPCEQSGKDLERDLIDGPIPRSNKCGNADGFVDDVVVWMFAIEAMFESKVFEVVNKVLCMRDASGSVVFSGEVDGSPHFCGDSFSHVFETRFVDAEYGSDEFDSFIDGGMSPCLEGIFCGTDGEIGIFFTSEGNDGTDLFIGRVDDVEVLSF